MTDASVLLTAWLSWCGGVTFTLMAVFGFVFLTSPRSSKRTPLVAFATFAVLTAALAVAQAGRLGYV